MVTKRTNLNNKCGGLEPGDARRPIRHMDPDLDSYPGWLDAEPQDPASGGSASGPPTAPAAPKKTKAQHPHPQLVQRTTRATAPIEGPSHALITHPAQPHMIPTIPTTAPIPPTPASWTMPSVAVAGANGETYIYRPWQPEELKDIARHLPDPVQDGPHFGVEFELFCRQYRPSAYEWRRLLAHRMKPSDMAKIEPVLATCQASATRVMYEDNIDYLRELKALTKALADSFPPHRDMRKVDGCRQGTEETLDCYLERLQALFERHSALAKGSTEYKVHLCHAIMRGIRDDVAEGVRTCYVRDLTHPAASESTTAGGSATGSPGASGVPAQEEGQEDLSSSQFVCETVIRSMALEEAPEPRPVPHPRAEGPGATGATGATVSAQGPSSSALKGLKSPGTSPSKPPAPLQVLCVPSTAAKGPYCAQAPRSVPTHLQASATAADEGGQYSMKSLCVAPAQGPQRGDRPRSRSSSTSSEDYIIILPDCFDTSRPLGDSMYSSALSQPGDIPAITAPEPDPSPDPDLSSDHPPSSASEPSPSSTATESSAHDMLCTSQTLEQEPLTPEVVAPPLAHRPESPGAGDPPAAEGSPAPETPHDEKDHDDTGGDPAEPEHEASEEDHRGQGLTGGLVKGALSVAASAYKALFTGQGSPQPPVDPSSLDTMLDVLQEMGFRERALNQRLLLKHNYNLLDVVNELVHLTEPDY
uniref:Nbr1-like C-terminal UBA domain-containing protein n=1 Tax=Knipowitschia caucasica TaxID=637954 RepID=A0AAV2M1F8_KNICA